MQDSNIPIVTEEPNQTNEDIKPETYEQPDYPKATTRRKSKLKITSKRKFISKPKKIAQKTKTKEKKVQDKNQIKEKRKQVCPICGMLVSFLPYHLEIHDPNIFYDCDICGHRAPSRTVIINHFRNKHFSKRYRRCGEEFSNCNYL